LANMHQRDIAAAALNAGATLFIGHHPHVVQDTQYDANGYIAYSLGNFIFDQTFSAETMEGLAVRATFEGATLKNIEELPIAISKQYQASPVQ
ncbi:MAG: CapA family protein, partial [Candidatus Spechtbacterales bacterium]